MISRDEAIQLLHTYAKDDHDLLWKSYAVEHILILLSKELDEDEKVWGLTGLLYDLDYEYTSKNPENHTLITANIVVGLVPDDAIEAIKSHNYLYTAFRSKSIMGSGFHVIIPSMEEDNKTKNNQQQTIVHVLIKRYGLRRTRKSGR